MDKNIVISIKTIALTALLAFAGFVIYRLGSIIGVIFIALLITISLEHTVKFLMRQKIFGYKINRSISVLLTYLFVFSLLAVSVSVGLDPVISQSQKLVQTLLKHQSLFAFGETFNFSLSEIVAGFAATSGGVLTATKSIFTNVAAVFSIMILSIYLSIDWENIKAKLISQFPERTGNKINKAIEEIEQNVGLWLSGQAILMLVIGIFSYIALVLIGVEFAFALAILSGVLEIVPIIGPVITAVVAALVAVVTSPVQALLVVGAFAIIQNVEGNILVPKVMQKVSGFSPITILLALLIGSNLFGIVGAIVAVPVLMIAAVVFKYTVTFKD